MNASSIISDVTNQFRENLRPLVMAMAESSGERLTPEQFLHFVSGLKDVLNQTGCTAFVQTVTALDETVPMIEHDGRKHRYKMGSTKDWLTPFGRVAIKRSYYQPDDGGKGVIPLDVRCGMVDRFMTPDVEEVSTLLSTMGVPAETKVVLGKILPTAPSVKAVQRAIADAGSFAEAHRREIDQVVLSETPLSAEGDVLVISWDGKMVPMREKGVKTGRPPERPGIRSGPDSPTAWHEAGVGTVSIYGPLDDKGRPQRLDGVYLARMPESGMKTLLEQQASIVRGLLDSRTFRELVVLCDGKETIWKEAARTPEYSGATFMLDFYHAAEHLSKTAEALFGKSSNKAKRWFDKHREGLQLDKDGVRATIRSIRYFRRRLRKNSERFAVATRAIRHFSRNRERMRYAEFIARGLPIGSGPVEAACKTVVGHRLNRSGMRWTTQGGQNILNLRTHLVSQRWDSFWNYYLKARHAA